MKAILSIIVALFVVTPSLFAGDSKPCDQAKACCAEKAKASECTSAKKSCPQAVRKALLTHKGAWVAQR